MEHLDCQTFFNYLVDEVGCRLRLNACAGIPDEEVRKIQSLDFAWEFVAASRAMGNG